MTSPLTVNAVTDVEINESCNCCLPFRRRNKHKHTDTDKKAEVVFERSIPKEHHHHHHQHKNDKK